MSVWTHIAGVIRIDDLRLEEHPHEEIVEKIDSVIGKECLWSSPKEIWEDAVANPTKYMPMGSEGSLQKSIWINPDPSCAAAYVVSIWGDLRDFDNVEEIKEWFNSICGKMWVRNAVITIECEDGNSDVVVYEE